MFDPDNLREFQDDVWAFCRKWDVWKRTVGTTSGRTVGKGANTKSENAVVLVSCFRLLFLINVPDIIKPLLSLANSFDVTCVFVLSASNMLG